MMRRIRVRPKFDASDFELVLTVRHVEPQKGMLALPASYMQIGETPVAAALRCVRQKTLLKGPPQHEIMNE